MADAEQRSAVRSRRQRRKGRWAAVVVHRLVRLQRTSLRFAVELQVSESELTSKILRRNLDKIHAEATAAAGDCSCPLVLSRVSPCES